MLLLMHTALLFSLLSGRGRKERGGGEGGDRQTEREREREGIGEQEGRRKSRNKRMHYVMAEVGGTCTVSNSSVV